MPGSRTRRGLVALAVIVVFVGAAAYGVRELWRIATSSIASSGCDFGNFSVDTGQAQVAATVVSVVIKRGLPERAAVLTLGAALQESKLRNIPAGQGDRDSVGILQQRPSQGWGTAEQISDVHYATGAFLDHLVKVPDWQTDSLATVVQEVQISADGSAYAKHETEASAIASALMGTTPAGVSCSFDKPSQVAAAASVAAALAADLPVNAPAVDGNAITVGGAGWATVGWFVCNADRFGIDSVRYDGKVWTRAKGWHADDKAADSAVVARLSSI